MVSVTSDLLMMRIPSCRASGSDRENGVGEKPSKDRDMCVGTDLLFDAIFSIDAVGPDFW